jgi:poly [ADP-ribose] polymerase
VHKREQRNAFAERERKMEEKYLVMVDASDNHNKFYKMLPDSVGSTFKVEYGRVGARPATRIYPASEFNNKYQEKIRKGYLDKTDLHKTVETLVTSQNKYRAIEDNEVRELIDKMLSWADIVIKKNYAVSEDQVNQDAIDRAQNILNKLAVYDKSVRGFNTLLQELFSVIPRAMRSVDKMLASEKTDYPEIIAREQALLDTMAGKVNTAPPRKNAIESTNTSNNVNLTILEANDLNIRQCTKEEITTIREYLDSETNARFIKAWHCENKHTRQKFDAYIKQHKIRRSGIKFLYHGSRNNCYWNIIKQGLKIRPTQKVTRAGKMFGTGLYFAPKAKKSVGYTDSGFWAKRTGSANYSNSTVLLLVFKVAMGKTKDIHVWNSSCSKLDESTVRNQGYDSVFAHEGTSLRNDECIVYNDDACTLSYIIELAS